VEQVESKVPLHWEDHSTASSIVAIDELATTIVSKRVHTARNSWFVLAFIHLTAEPKRSSEDRVTEQTVLLGTGESCRQVVLRASIRESRLAHERRQLVERVIACGINFKCFPDERSPHRIRHNEASLAVVQIP
jgi:hypothetical protein